VTIWGVSNLEPSQGGQPAESRRNTVLVVLLLVVTLVLSAGAALFALRPSGVAEISAAGSMARCNGTNAATCVGETALAIAEQEGVAAGLDAVRMLLETRPDIREGCHSVAHEVGNAFFERYGEQAIVPGHNWCSWGYYHGLMQTYSEDGTDGLVDYAKQLCNKVDGSLTVDCIHGVGHAAYMNLRAIAPSLTICETLEGDLATTCADAVIMEELFLSPNGRLTSGFTPQDCLTSSNPDVVAGCARGLTSDQVLKGLDLQASCGVFTGTAFASCTDGYGSALAGNELSGSSAPLNSAMYTSCSAELGCAAGYGWIAYMYLIDSGRAEAACQRNFSGPGLESCLTSTRGAASRETLR
jgi:hypothetical protein